MPAIRRATIETVTEAQDSQSLHGVHGDILTVISEGMVALLKEYQQDPDMICEAFVLAPSSLVEPHEVPARTADSRSVRP